MIRPLKQFIESLASHHAHDLGKIPASKTDRVAGRKGLSWKKKSVLSGIVLLTFFAALELILAGFGVRPYREVHDPFLDFEPGIRLFVREGAKYVTNPVKRTYFNDQSFSDKKRPNSFRIFCLGGSTTYGRPYQDGFSYVSGLRKLLQRLNPEQDWQVINCGGISYSSYRLAALMEELAQYQPDLIVFYEGHNEFLEERTYRDLRERSGWITASVQAVSHLRATTVLQRLLKPWQPTVVNARMKAEVDVILDHTVGPETYHRDPNLRRSVLNHFRASVERVCALSHRAGAKVILIQPACNLRDFSPFKSEPSHSLQQVVEFEQHVRAGREALRSHEPHKALQELTNAVALDPVHADAQFLAGQAALEAGDAEIAREHFLVAKDEDVCPLRALTEIAPIVEDIGRANGAAVIRFPEYVADRCRRRLGHDIAGSESFVDHVHPTPELHLELAVLLVREMVRISLIRLGRSESIDEAYNEESKSLVQALTPSIKADALCSLAQELTWAGKIREALPIAREAAELDAENAWVLCQYGRLLERSEDNDGALAIYRRVIEIDPNEALGLERLGNALLRRGNLAEARELLSKAVAHPADSAAPLSFRTGVRVSLGDCLLRMGNVASARQQYREAFQIDPESKLAKDRLRHVSQIPPEPSTWNPSQRSSKSPF